MARIIPGVQVTVVKEVVPQQLSPSGVLGLVGVVERGGGVQRAASWSRFVELFGPGSAWSLPEARQALENGVFELVVSPVDASSASSASGGVGDGTNERFKLTARAAGVWSNGLKVELSQRKKGDAVTGIDLAVQRPGEDDPEKHQNLHILPGHPRYIGSVLAARSSLVQAESSRTLALATTGGSGTDLSAAGTASLNLLTDDKSTALVKIKVVSAATVNVKVTGTAAAANVVVKRGQVILAELTDVKLSTSAWDIVDALDELEDVTVEVGGWPNPGSATLAGGTDAGLTEYRDAIDALKEEGDVDMVLAAPQDFSKPDKIARIYSAVIAHSEVMAADSKGRVGFGQVAPGATSDQAGELAQSLVSDRFVLVAPSGCVGAVAGRVGGLSYFQSPTFKTISGVPKLSVALGIEAQQALLRTFVLPVVKERGRGVIVVKGITTDGDQINVRRVADRAVRGVKMIGDLFIGRLNTADGRAALKQKLAELLLQMEKDGAIVPSTDGTDPAFKVDVYSSQSDFAQGIVRVDMAVRPVRAIDYIYATVLVQA